MPVQTKKIFADSSFLVAFIDRSDTNHTKAVKVMERLAELGYQLYTSGQNISEVYNLLAREIGVSIAMDFLQASLVSNMEILFPQKVDLAIAHKVLKTNKDRQISLREVMNANLMEKRGVVQILTFTYWHNLFGTYVSSLVRTMVI